VSDQQGSADDGQDDQGGQSDKPDKPDDKSDAKSGDGTGKETKESVDQLQAALGDERKLRRELQSKLDKLEREHMTETDKAIAEAKEAGRNEAILTAGKRLAAAEFRAAAAGKITDPSAALEVLDLGKFVGDDGEPDTKAITGLVERLAAALPPPPPGKVPPGARTADPDTDFIRAAAGHA
jgi:hypothetical protein